MAWTRVTLLPVGAFSSRTWLGRDDQGREALLREVPEGAMPSGSGVTPAGVVPLRDVVVIDGRRYGVWDLLKAESLQEVVERVLDTGGTVPLGFLCRVVIDAARSLVAMTPMRPHGGLSDASLLITRDGRVQVMDFGCPRPGRFTPSGAPSFVNDVFSMGAVLHASLTGFGGTYADALTEGLQLPTPSQLHDECTPAVDDVVLRAISRAVDKRQPDLELFADELEAVLGEQLFTEAQVGQFLSGAAPARPGPPVPDVDPGPAPGIDDGPTGQHPMLGNKETFTDLPPIAPQVPLGTQPGAPADAFAAVAAPDDAVRYAGIPMSTQPGVPGPAMLQSSPSRPPLAVPLDTQPGLKLPAEPAPVPVETQPRLQLPTSSPSGAVPKSPPVLHASGATPDALARAVPKSPPVLRTSEPAPLDAAAGAIPKPQPAPRASAALDSEAGAVPKPQPAPRASAALDSGAGAAPKPQPAPRASALDSGAGAVPKPQPAPRTSGPAQVPLETQPRVRVPTSTGLSAAPKPQGARSGPGAPAETDRRLPKPADTADEGPDTGPQPVPVAASSVSHAKLEWAQTQARVPTPPLGVPALDDSAPGLGDDEERDEPTAIRPLSAAARPQLTSGTSPELAGVSEASLSVVTDVKPSSSSSRKVIAALLLVVTAVFGAMVWKLKGSGSAGASTIARVTPVLLLDEDGGEPRAAPAPAVPADSGDHGHLDPDGGDDFEDDDDDGGEAALEEEDAGPHDVDAGVGDGGSQPRPVKKKKPTKRRRRR